ncbi:hypothetical protein D3C81_1592570 [compost metagenome]
MNDHLVIFLVTPDLDIPFAFQRFNAVLDNVDESLFEFGRIPFYVKIFGDMRRNFPALQIGERNQNALNMNKLIKHVQFRNFSAFRLCKG